MNNKVPQQINDIVGDNVKKLAQLFPSVVKDGEVDFKALKEELGQYEEVGSEKYELTWAGKKNAKRIAQEDVIGRTLKFIPEDSKDADTTENLYIEGDNLEVLKLLRQNYYGAIKMIYIDPPYNTGNDFVYNDSFEMSESESNIVEGTISVVGEKYVINNASTNKYHAKWLSMLYSRLKIAKDLLSDDGIISISIDEHEFENLIKLCKEVFGEQNYIGSIVVKSNPRGSMSTAELASLHEYLVLFAKSRNDVNIIGHALSENMLSEYKYEDAGGKYRLLGLRMRGGFWRRSERPNLYFPIYVNPNTGGVSLKKNYEFPEEALPIQPSTMEDGTWRWSKDKILLNSDQIIGRQVSRQGELEWDIFQKDYLSRGETRRTKAKSIWDESEINYQNGTEEVKRLLGKAGVFDYSKPVFLIKQIMNMLDLNNGDIVLDFFSGAATTAQAVFEYNIENNAQLFFGLVQLPELCDEKTEAYKSGYTNICEIGKERIRRAGDKIKSEHPDADIDIGFKVFRTADTNIKWNSLMDMGQVDMNQLEYTPDLVDFMPDANDIDVVYELMLRQRDVALSETLEQLTDIGSRTYLYASSYLVCLETQITQELVGKLAELDPLPIKFIFRDSAFKDDIALKDETFRRLKALIEKNAGTNKPTYTVEFI